MDKKRAWKIKNDLKIVDYEISNKKMQAVDGVSVDDIEWAVNSLYENLNNDNKEIEYKTEFILDIFKKWSDKQSGKLSDKDFIEYMNSKSNEVQHILEKEKNKQGSD